MTPPSPPPMDLDGFIRRCGLGIVFCAALLVPISFGIAPFTPLGVRQPEEILMFGRLLEAVHLTARPGGVLNGWLTGDSILASPPIRAAAYLLPVVGTTVLFILALRALVKHRRLVTTDTSRLIFRTAAAVALLGILAYPMFTNDFWLSIGWGRMVASGHNPYYETFTVDALRGVPRQDYGDLMTYGPLWAVLNGGLAIVAGSSVFLGYMLGKGVLVVAWLATMLLIGRMARAQGYEASAAIAMCIFGWMPMSSEMAIIEGHNDIVMVALFTLWLYLVFRERFRLSPFALAASVLIKYVSAPFALLDALALYLRRASRRAYLASALGATAIMVLAFLPFYRGPGMFEEAARMRGWVFWTPATTVRDLAALAGLRLNTALLTRAVEALLGAGLLVTVIRYCRQPEFLRLVSVVLAGFALILLAGVGHVWPWFAIWLLPAAALLWRSPAAWAAFAFCLMIPVLNQGWYLERDWALRPLLGILLYAGTAAGFLVLWRWMPTQLRERT